MSSAAGIKKQGGGAFSLADFLPHEQPRETDDDDEREMTFAEFLQAIK